jgi:hypothetical protein
MKRTHYVWAVYQTIRRAVLGNVEKGSAVLPASELLGSKEEVEDVFAGKLDPYEISRAYEESVRDSKVCL